MTIKNIHNFDDNSLGKLSLAIFVTMMTVDDLMLTATTTTTIDNINLTTLDGNSMLRAKALRSTARR
jgi:hypothetical protein